MISLTREGVVLALEQEKLTAYRQSLLKQLWRLDRREQREPASKQVADLLGQKRPAIG